MELEERRGCFRCPPTTNKKRVAPYAHRCLDKSNVFTSESTKKQGKRGKEVAGWRFLQKLPSFTKFMQKLPSFTKFMQKLPSFTKFMQKLPSFTKKSKKNPKKLPSFTKNLEKKSSKNLQKTQKKLKPPKNIKPPFDCGLN